MIVERVRDQRKTRYLYLDNYRLVFEYYQNVFNCLSIEEFKVKENIWQPVPSETLSLLERELLEEVLRRFFKMEER